jgi:nicotinamidase-related amidase
MTADTALLIIDVQQGFDEPYWGNRNNPDAESKIALLLCEWRKRKLPVIHVRHLSVESGSPLRPELPGCEFKEEVQPQPDEKQFTKSVNSAFIGTGLEEYLRTTGITSLIVVGLTTDHCISTTVRMAANLGFTTTLVSDATATFDRKGFDSNHYSAEQIHRVSLVSLDGEFCSILTTAQILKDLAQ